MIYDESNIVGVKFKISGLKHIILEHPYKRDHVQISKSGNLNGSRGDWDKRTVVIYLNDNGGWKPVTNSPTYEIY